MNGAKVVAFGGCVALVAACATEERPSRPVEPEVISVAYLRSGELALFTSHELVIYDHGLGQERGRIAYPGMPSGAYLRASALSADGQVAAVGWSVGSGDDVEVVAFRFPSGAVMAQLLPARLASGPIPSPTGEQAPMIQLSPPGDLLSLQRAGDQVGATFEVHDVSGGALRWSAEGIGASYVFSPDGALIYGYDGRASTSVSGLVALDARTGAVARRLGGADTNALAASTDGHWLVGSANPGTNPNRSFSQYSVWRTSDGTSTNMFDEAPDCGAVAPLAMAPDGAHWASYAQDLSYQDRFRWGVHLWTRTGTLLLALPTTRVSFPTFSPDGAELAVGPLATTAGPTVSVFRVSDGAPVASLLTTPLAARP